MVCSQFLEGSPQPRKMLLGEIRDYENISRKFSGESRHRQEAVKNGFGPGLFLPMFVPPGGLVLNEDFPNLKIRLPDVAGQIVLAFVKVVFLLVEAAVLEPVLSKIPFPVIGHVRLETPHQSRNHLTLVGGAVTLRGTAHLMKEDRKPEEQ